MYRRQACASRNQVTHDDVFLEALQHVDLAERRSIGEDARRLLEGCGRDEALGFERSLRDTKQDRLSFGRFAASFFDSLVFSEEQRAINLLTPEVFGVARISDPNFAKHLADDDFDVLVVDRHTLETINFLHLRNQEVVQRRWPEDFENFVWVGRTFGKVLAFVNHVAGLHDDVLAGRR